MTPDTIFNEANRRYDQASPSHAAVTQKDVGSVLNDSRYKQTIKKRFAKLPESVEGYVKSAIRNSRMLRIKYYPNKTGGRRVGWRVIQPLLFFTKSGVQYCLALFLGGSSVSDAGFGQYRLFILDRIQEIEFYDQGITIQQFSRLERIDYKLVNRLLQEQDY